MFNVSSNCKQELSQLIEDVTKERNQYNEYKIIIEVILECTKPPSKLNSNLRTKILNILMANDVGQCSDLNLKDTSLLGLDALTQNQLNYEENEALRATFQSGVSLKSRKLTKDLEKMGITTVTKKVIETCPVLDLTHEEKALIELKESLNVKQVLYVSKLQELLLLYESILKLRIDTLPDLANKVVVDCEIRTKVHSLKSEILERKTLVEIFMEEKESMEYYSLVLKNLMQQQEECKAEIERLKVLREKYKQVSCKQYDEILQSYLKFKCGVDLKRGFVNPLTMK